MPLPMSGQRRMEIEDPELGAGGLTAYDCSGYYVQSPSTTISHAHSSNDIHNILPPTIHHHQLELLSRYSSSRGSNYSSPFPTTLGLHPHHHNKSDTSFDVQSHEDDQKRLIIAPRGSSHDRVVDVVSPGGIHHKYYKEADDEDDDEVYYDDEKKKWWRYLSLSYSSSMAWIMLQISWRLVVSLCVGLLVFYVATKPPAPKFAVKVGGIPEFGLGEGVDSTGVSTKLLTSNVSLHLSVDNRSKLFALHIQPPVLDLYFGRIPLATSHQCPEAVAEEGQLNVGSEGWRRLVLYVGTRNKAMYGAGRSMEDMLAAKQGLGLTVRMRWRSSFHVVKGLIHPTFRHQAHCFLLLTDSYDPKRATQAYNSTCSLSPR